MAWGIEDDRLLAPDWMSPEKYYITAIVPPGATKEQLPAMWQAANGPEAPIAPSIQKALEEQLGLAAQSKKTALDVLAMDHAEKTPTAN